MRKFYIAMLEEWNGSSQNVRQFGLFEGGMVEILIGKQVGGLDFWKVKCCRIGRINVWLGS